ncbi:MAG: TIM barrel protein [Acidimicrobiales bacterium]
MSNPLCLNLFQYSPYAGTTSVPSLDDLLIASADAGFELVGLDMYSLDQLEVSPGAVARSLQRHGLRCFEMLGLSVDRDETTSLAMARSVARWVGEAHADWVLTVVSAPVDDELVDRFGRCADLVVAEGGRLALEFLPFLPVSTIESASAVCDAVGAARARVLIDSWHVFRGTDTLAGVAATPADAIGYVQFDDALPVIGELHDEVMTRRIWPGKGEFDLVGFADAVKATGYLGPISVELLNQSWRLDGLRPAEFARRAMQTSRPYWT